ncbi:MobC family plasmid mobilization relaxosome protein [Jiella marina]|uniref:MobC family plasmid mobilization relaxosome protein n=1 Tax=Jiella sp. LLJ827 TaxID=2917712 RepID=UPI0021014C34|nr:MobC family plasmid mobilization relaxosome protein [Jiella sp. LLJ827]MCQ0987236.1 MobC family plasmid mobilization relaxosome protein [Jiella sp. LLJ827]
MSTVRQEFTKASFIGLTESVLSPCSRPRHKTTRDCPRVTVRFSPEDYERLQTLADGMTLSVYVRAMALGEELNRRKARSPASIADRAAVAEILGLLGESRIANNLNQLAYQANVGTLAIDDESRSKIDEAYQMIFGMRALLLKALGRRG